MTASPGQAGDDRIAEEQAALRRVATLVAHAAPPAEVLTAITGEAGRLLHADHATMARYGTDDTATVLATWGSADVAAIPVGSRHKLSRQDMGTIILQTRRPARIDDPADLSFDSARFHREVGIRGAVGVPVSVDGRLWGVMVVESGSGPLPAGTEARLAGFTELAATAIANAEAQAALTASRARIVAAADATRRRIERDLHDGAQQRLVSLALDLRAARGAVTGGVAQQLDRVASGMDGLLEDLREIARGLHPAILAGGGLRPALKTLARRSAVPAHVDIQVEGRLPEPVEIAAYYTVSEALTNAAKHAHATAADVQVTVSDGVLHVRVRDDGRGGAEFSNGSGLVGLRDRAEAAGGHIQLCSPPGAGTILELSLPLGDQARPPLEAAGPAGSGSRGPAADPGQRFDQPGAARRADPSPPDRG
jgi:signal transduction histidine kinase